MLRYSDHFKSDLTMAALRKSKAARAHTSKGFNARAFYEVLSSVVEARSVAWRQVARETGITPSTLTRMGQGRRLGRSQPGRLRRSADGERKI
jgi:hypothetical protein